MTFSDRMKLLILPAVLILALCASAAHGAPIIANSCSLGDVRAAVSAAADGDVVKIPDGSCSWTGGISTTKQIRIEAQNYTPTPGGTMSRRVTITNNAGSSPLIAMTAGNNHHVGVVGIRFNDGNGVGNYIRMSGTGSKVPLVADCSFEWELRNGNNPTNAMIAWLAQGGVMWNAYHASVRSSPSQIGGVSIFMNHPRAWTTPSTMGLSGDPDGNINFYIEDSTAIDIDAFLDVDRGGRVVARNNSFDGTWFLTHGFTSGTYGGGRHIEIYDNKFRSSRTDEARNLAGRYFWLRAGTALITDNDVAGPVRTQDYGSNIQILQIGDNTTPAGSDGPMQPGWGHNGNTDVRDPIYVWGNSGNMGSSVGFNNQNGDWRAVTGSNELVVDSGPKPGWSKYRYPHPMRSAISGPSKRPMPPADIKASE